ncbi:thaumatin, partial [Fennellomyces sp. T-0311]
VQVVIKNNCSDGITVGQLQNGQSQGVFQAVSHGGEYTFDLPNDWQGRYWARANCVGDECNALASVVNPASLAEVTFAGWGGNDYYDLSFVDGFNLPVSMSPINPSDQPGEGDAQYRCGSPTCTVAPECPEEMKVYNSANELVGCQSACSHYGTDEYCCAGEHNTPETCSPNEYSKAVEAVCPDAYSYAYDDTTSTYTCAASGYTVTFC